MHILHNSAAPNLAFHSLMVVLPILHGSKSKVDIRTMVMVSLRATNFGIEVYELNLVQISCSCLNAERRSVFISRRHAEVYSLVCGLLGEHLSEHDVFLSGANDP